MKNVVTFGEVMLRLSPPANRRLVQADSFDVTFGGAEANVAASLARIGAPAEFVTALPHNDIADRCLRHLRSHRIGTDNVVRRDGRMGLYYVEPGTAQRGGNVIYDRRGSALARIEPGDIDWNAAFDGADWLHWTGITPAVSESAAEACAEALEVASDAGLTVSCDLNYRSKLWNWCDSPEPVMRNLMKHCDFVVADDYAADVFFGISAPEPEDEVGMLDPHRCGALCEQFSEQFPRLDTVAFTGRKPLSASHHTWTALLWQEGDVFTSPRYDIQPVVDRVGSGDAFCAALIYALKTDMNDQEAVEFAAAAGCLKHGIWGDFNLASKEEIEELAAGKDSGRVSR